MDACEGPLTASFRGLEVLMARAVAAFGEAAAARARGQARDIEHRGILVNIFEMSSRRVGSRRSSSALSAATPR